MKVIFIEDFKKYKSGDIIFNLNKGYIRNYLIPKFKVFFINKKLLRIKNILKDIIIRNDVEKKNFFKKLYNKFNNKNIYINYFFYLNKKNNLCKWILKKIGFIYYSYNISFFKNNKNNYLFNILIYNNIYIKFFVYFKLWKI